MKTYFIFFLALYSFSVAGQDHIYSQIMAAPTYLNPALTGTGANCHRVGLIYRHQWMRVPSGMQYGTVFYDKYAERAELGLGGMATYSQEGYLKKSSLALQVSKEVLTGSSFPISFGAQLEGGNVDINWNKLYFPTQITDAGLFPSIPSGIDKFRSNRFYFDLSAGTVVNFKNWMFGFAVHNLVQHDESITGTFEARLPRRFSLHASHLTYLGFHDDDDEPGERIILNVAAFMQAKNLTAMAGAEYKGRNLNVGLSYRANLGPIRSDALMLTLAWENFLGNGRYGDNRTRYAITYEPTLTNFGYNNTFGSGEMSISHGGGGGECSPSRRYSLRSNWRQTRQSMTCPYHFTY
jgi:type IX secretion system PorP/SprF family membrane protein